MLNRSSQPLTFERLDETPLETAAAYLIDDSTRCYIEEMKKMFESETSTKHSLLRIEKHFDKCNEAFEDLANGILSISNTLIEFVRLLKIVLI